MYKRQVEDCVNRVGVDLNTASAPLLEYISGISKTVAKNIVEYREANGRFTNRKQLLKVPKLGPKAFEQCAGFLRVPESKQVLDRTGVHPESYDAAKKLAVDFGITEQKPSILAKLQRGKSQAETERRCFRVLGDYLQILQDWKTNCAPQLPEDAIDPRYAEACHMLERIENMLDILTCGTPKERAEVVTDLQKDNRLALMEARNRQIREESHGTK